MTQATRSGRTADRAWARGALAHPILSGISRAHPSELTKTRTEVGGRTRISPAPTTRWQPAQGCRRRAAGAGLPAQGCRRRAAGAGPRHRLTFIDRILATLVHLRHQLPHAALAQLYGVDRSTVSAAIREIRPLLAARGFAVPDHLGLRIRTLADLFAYANTEGVRLRLHGTETQVRRPQAHRPGRRAFVSGKRKQTPSRPPASATTEGAYCSPE